MKSAAVIIGINDYPNPQHRLTSPVNDAVAIRQALLDLNLVQAADITLLTAPAQEADAPLPTRRGISRVMQAFYNQPEAYERLFFFYSGHGLLAFADGARTLVRNALMPVDVQDPLQDFADLINFDELRELLRYNGPREQFYFVDACRELSYTECPGVTSLGWGSRGTLGPDNCQATLFAVAPQGIAAGRVGDLGRMTSHLLDALRSETLAVQYVESEEGNQPGRWGITMRSLADYVKVKVEEELAKEPQWKKIYNSPRLEGLDPQPNPVRVFAQAPETSLSVHITPDALASSTKVTLLYQGTPVDSCCLPPRHNHEVFSLRPQVYWLEARSSVGEVNPRQVRLDARREREAHINVSALEPEMSFGLPGAAGPEPSPVPVDLTPAQPYEEERSAYGNKRMARLQAEANEPLVAIEVEPLDSPRPTIQQFGRLDEEVQPGAYRIRFRLGQDVFNEKDIVVRPGEKLVIAPTVASTPLLAESLGLVDSLPQKVAISESIGEMQAGVLNTMLPIIGVKPFDVKNELFHQFSGQILMLNPEEFDLRPLSVVVAVDGSQWSAPVEQVLQSLTCCLVPAGEAGSPQPLALIPLRQRGVRGGGTTGPGLERVAVAITKAPDAPTWLEFSTPHFGSYRLAVGALDRRATVITLLLRSDGVLDITQNLLRLPGREDLYRQELAPHVPYGRMLRELQLGQQLYKSDEMLELRRSDLGMELVYAKWTDPVLGCMAFYAWRGEALRSGRAEEYLYRHTAKNLNRFFPGLPDSRVIYGQVFEKKREEVYAQLLKEGALPVLAESTRLLAAWAEEKDDKDAAVVKAARRVKLGQPWTLTLA
jgi:hypothetical protein